MNDPIKRFFYNRLLTIELSYAPAALRKRHYGHRGRRPSSITSRCNGPPGIATALLPRGTVTCFAFLGSTPNNATLFSLEFSQVWTEVPAVVALESLPPPPTVTFARTSSHFSRLIDYRVYFPVFAGVRVGLPLSVMLDVHSRKHPFSEGGGGDSTARFFHPTFPNSAAREKRTVRKNVHPTFTYGHHCSLDKELDPGVANYLPSAIYLRFLQFRVSLRLCFTRK